MLDSFHAVKIKGKIIKGHSEAQQTLQMQKGFLKQYVPDFGKYHLGTINIQLEKTLNLHPDIETPPLKWDIRQDPVPEENFGFVKIKFEIIGKDNDPINALIYIAYNSPHYTDPSYIEIIAPFIKHNESDYCYIIIENK